MADLVHIIEHHAKDKGDIVREISFAYATKLSPLGWRTRTVRGGAESWMIYHPNKIHEYHFRNGGNGTVIVKDSYHKGKNIATLRTRLDVWRWVRKVTR